MEPTWDLSAYFPSFDSPERAAFDSALASDLVALLHDAEALDALSRETQDAWVGVVLRYEDGLGRFGHTSSYVTCLASAAADDERFGLAEGALGAPRATLEKCAGELRRALGAASAEELAGLLGDPRLAGAEHFLSQLHVDAQRRMPAALEALASDLATDGIFGWGRLYDTVAGKLSFELTLPDGTHEVVPMAARRSRMADPDRAVREAAFTAGNRAWEAVSDVTAAALNRISGTRLALYRRRGVEHFHDAALHDAGISRRTLDAMNEAVVGGRPLARRGLLLKARAMGLPAIAWYDLEAPLPLPETERIPWERGRDLVRRAFAGSYPALAAHVDEALAKRWIEAEPRAGKRPGAYCTGSDLTGESRVFMTYQGALGDVSTLAHELGHSFHHHVLAGTRVLARQYPMTLAETASTFAESVLSAGLLAEPGISAAARAQLLGEVAGDAAAFLLDVPTRFLFESRFYELRSQGEVPASRLSSLMVEAQREVFGEALQVGAEDPLFWASKLHFFIPDLSFYNFPYTFGYLLSRGLYARFTEEGPSFLPRYEAFLRATGGALAHEVARASIGEDLESPEFWARAIATLEAPIAELEAALGEVMGAPPP
ncbi:MAG: M3 family oligoendopeptidase [Myxococcales bacterium]|nr:M3 family oligoendopeptidase [Myxococcales bacterium]